MQLAEALVVTNLVLLLVLKLVCFLLGYGVVRLGAELLREGVKGEFKFKGSFVGAKADLISASPGLLFLLLGVALIAYAMWVPKEISYSASMVGAVAETKPPDVKVPSPAKGTGQEK